MSIELHTDYTNGTYEDTLYSLLKQFEGIAWQPYLDTTGNPTIGLGFNLTDPTVFNVVATTLGINPNDPSNPRDAYWYNQLFQAALNSKSNGTDPQFALDAVMLDRWADSTDTAANKLPAFEFDGSNETQIQEVFNKIISNYEKTVDGWLTWNLPAGSVAPSIGQSNERIVEENRGQITVFANIPARALAPASVPSRSSQKQPIAYGAQPGGWVRGPQTPLQSAGGSPARHPARQ